jgi:hypothetical protein
MITTPDQRGDIPMAAPMFSRRFSLRPLLPAALALLALALPAVPAAALPELHFVERGGPSVEAIPPLPPAAQFPVQLVLDDDTWEGQLGVGGATSVQFLWFNRFASPGPFTLQEIWVLFPPGETVVGDDVQLAVYRDTDGVLANGGTLLASYNAEVLAADGNTFSVYDLSATPLDIESGGEIWIGVINRWVVPGVTPLAAPATIDTDTDIGWSAFATWTGSPPDPPTLEAATIQNLSSTPATGTFLIRAFGTTRAIVEVPALDHAGLALFAVLLTAAAIGLFFRRA